MSGTVRIPTPLRRVTNGQDKVSVEGSSLSEVVGALDAQFPGLKERLCDEQGEIRNFVNIYVNGEDVRFLQGLDSETKSGDEISIVPAVAGGVLTPPPMHDPKGKIGRLYGRAARDQQSDLTTFFRLVVRLPFLPVLLPMALMRRRRRSREQVGFAEACISEGETDHRLIATRWVEAHPEEFASFQGIQRQFRNIVRKTASATPAVRHQRPRRR